jgi:internalin A
MSGMRHIIFLSAALVATTIVGCGKKDKAAPGKSRPKVSLSTLTPQSPVSVKQPFDQNNKDHIIIETAIRKSIHKPTGELTKTDIEKVRVLDLHGNMISDLTPLVVLINLEELWLNKNQITNLKPLVDLKKLKGLALNNNQIKDLTPLSRLAELEYLTIQNNKITDLAPLAELKALEVIDLRGNQVTDLTPMAGMHQVKWLSIEGNQLSDEQLQHLKGLVELELLGLSFNQISDLGHLSQLSKLGHLLLFGNPNLTRSEVDKLQKALPKCTIRHNVLK